MVSHLSKLDPQSSIKLFQNLAQTSTIKSLFLFTDGSTSGTSQLLSNIKLPIIGASTLSNNQSHQYYEKQSISDSAVAASISGNISISTVTINPWTSITSPASITKSQSNIIQEINNKPATKYFQEILNLQQSPQPEYINTYPLGIKFPNSNFTQIITPVKIENDQIFTNQPLPQNCQLFLATSSRKEIIKQAELKIQQLSNVAKEKHIQYIQVFSSTSQQKLQLNQKPDIVELIKQRFPTTPIIGIDAISQIHTDPTTSNTTCDNGSTTINLISD